MRSDALGQASAPEKSPVLFEPNLRVLIADDALMNRRLLRRAFTCYFGPGWSVTEATTAEEAVLLATETAFEVIVMDESGCVVRLPLQRCVHTKYEPALLGGP